MIRQNGPLLAITMGEPSGIGGELVLKAWIEHSSTPSDQQPTFFILDSPNRLRDLAVHFGLDVPIQVIDTPQDAYRAYKKGLPVIPIALPEESEPGTPHISNMSAVIESIKKAVDYTLSGQASGVVTNPIHKASLYAAGFRHNGHTEFLDDLCRSTNQKTKRAVMMLTSSLIDPPLRVVPVTIHTALRQAIADLRTDRIIETALTVVQSLREDFGITNPRLAVAALNPHAGEAGKMGDEEERILQPAIDHLQKKNMHITPPLPADSLFRTAPRKTYDAVLCMYHDQALIPLKTLDFRGGVNVTLGLPIIRTSPDHGPALDIAARGQADPKSFIAAVMIANQLALHRECSQ